MSQQKMLEVVSEMPVLKHSLEGEPEFDIKKSEVVNWLINQPEVLNWMFFQIRDLGAIVYDPEIKVWHGEVVAPRISLTPEQLLEVLTEHRRLTFTEWRHHCETRFNVQCGMWSFVRPSQVLVERGIVAKVGSLYRICTKT